MTVYNYEKLFLLRMIENVATSLVDIGVAIIKDIPYRTEGTDERIHCIIIEILFGKKTAACPLSSISLSCG